MIGMMVSRNSNVRKIAIKNRDGSTAGSITITKPKAKKTKPLQYNFKQLSRQIMQTKTSVNAKQVVTRSRAKVASLRQKLYSEQYDYSEIRHALIHAEKMVRIAKKRMKHLQEEESCKKGGACQGDTEDERLKWEDVCDTDMLTMSADKMKEIMQELDEQMRELEQEFMDGSGLSDLTEEITPVASREMDPEDLELLKKKHRSEELREIMEADMKYLKALFNKLAREKQEGSSTSNNFSNEAISLELGGLEIPVDVMEAPVVTEGANLDVMA